MIVLGLMLSDMNFSLIDNIVALVGNGMRVVPIATCRLMINCPFKLYILISRLSMLQCLLSPYNL